MRWCFVLTRILGFPQSTEVDHFCEDLVEKAMATHSSVLAWRIPGTGEPRELLSGVAQSRT